MTPVILPRQSHESLPVVTDRRAFLKWVAGTGVAGAGWLGASTAWGQGTPPTPPPVPDGGLRAAAEVAGLEFTAPERELMGPGVAEHRENFRKLRTLRIENNVMPALLFSPLIPGLRNVAEGMAPAGYPLHEAVWATRGRAPERPHPPDSGERKPIKVRPDDPIGPPGSRRPDPEPAPPPRPSSDEDVAFLPARELGALIRARRLSSLEATRIYLDRIRRYDPQLLACITVTEELALRQAQQADEEIARGQWRGPLHGVPYGLKDLIDTQGIATTWGAEPFRGRVPRSDATVVERLRVAGAVLVAKTAVGALAWGDVWFGGTTKNPWKRDQGASGSSAGSAAGVVAGLFGFALGTETLGSIVSPSTRCGATGLRPTFGRISRHGAMALSWSMDKLGPIGRSVEDLAVVFEAVRGPDGLDPTVIDAPFTWQADRPLSDIRIGYDLAAFQEKRDDSGFDDQALDVLRRLGVNLVPVRLPDFPTGDILFVLEAEAAAAFDELTRTNQDDQLKRQVADAWPNVFRAARLIPAVEYIQANRARTLLMQQMDAMLAEVDVYVHPTFAGSTLLIANLTGQPTVVAPNGLRADGTPVSLCFTGRLFGEAATLRVAAAYERATGWARLRPPLG